MSSLDSFQNSPYLSVKHSTYFQAYDDLLEEYKGKNITFIEIGVLSGGSLFMWRDYFGAQARIIGVDLNQEAIKWREYGFEIWVGDQSSPQFWETFLSEVGPVDVILDDGGHTYKQQISTVICLLPSIRDRGKLIIEDTHTSYMESFGNRRYNFINWTSSFVREMNMRFSGFSGLREPDRVSGPVWKVSNYESMVAFHVDRSKSQLESKLVKNSGIQDQAVDIRYSLETNALTRIMSFLGKSKIIQAIPFSKFVHKTIANALRMDTKTLKRFFRKISAR